MMETSELSSKKELSTLLNFVKRIHRVYLTLINYSHRENNK